MLHRRIPLKHYHLLVAGAIALISGYASQNRADASVVFFDTFTAPDDTALVGRMPSPTDAPAVTYAGNGNVSIVGGPTGGTPYEADVQGNAARIGADAGLALNLGISTATQLELSITFNISGDTQTQANDAHRGAGLGFFSSVTIASGGSSHGFNNFTGLVVDRTGSVRLIVAGANSGIFATVGGFDPALVHTLSFQVDTTAGVGTISDILLDSTSVSLTAPVDTFTIARTTYAGFYNSSGSATDLANFPDFYVAIVPETTIPGAVLLMMLVGLTALYSPFRDRLIPPNRSASLHSRLFVQFGGVKLLHSSSPLNKRRSI